MLASCWQLTCIRTCSPKPPSCTGGVISKDFPGELRALSVGDQDNRPALPQRPREQLGHLIEHPLGLCRVEGRILRNSPAHGCPLVRLALIFSVPRRQRLLEVLDVLRCHAPEGRYGRGEGRKAFATRPGER